MMKLHIRMLRDVVSELPLQVEAPVIAEKGKTYPALRFGSGTVVIVLADGSRLGVKPGEYEIEKEGGAA